MTQTPCVQLMKPGSGSILESWKSIRRDLPIEFLPGEFFCMTSSVLVQSSQALKAVSVETWCKSVFKVRMCCRMTLNFPFQAIGIVLTHHATNPLCAVGGTRWWLHAGESERYPPSSTRRIPTRCVTSPISVQFSRPVKAVFPGYPAKRALPAMLTHGW